MLNAQPFVIRTIFTVSWRNYFSTIFSKVSTNPAFSPTGGHIQLLLQAGINVIPPICIRLQMKGAFIQLMLISALIQFAASRWHCGKKQPFPRQITTPCFTFREVLVCILKRLKWIHTHTHTHPHAVTEPVWRWISWAWLQTKGRPADLPGGALSLSTFRTRFPAQHAGEKTRGEKRG